MYRTDKNCCNKPTGVNKKINRLSRKRHMAQNHDHIEYFCQRKLIRIQMKLQNRLTVIRLMKDSK